MTFHYETAARLTDYTPTEEDRRSLEEWFARYDADSARGDVAALADAARFPLNLVTDDSAGDAWCGRWDRAEFTDTMTRVMGDAGGEPGEMSFASERTPVFLGPALAVVFSRSTMTAGGESRELVYADVLVRSNGRWAFQTMIQQGWGGMLKDAGPDASPHAGPDTGPDAVRDMTDG
ncbi:nuclear transport factor 2 family protein [Streptomyces sp. TRM70308]|uniref:nuclear transport factor 2 family protein n=1 Tax=Streptomyces sp. TRM70308 TaxID=3131932 RepID=UPI003CFDB7AB